MRRDCQRERTEWGMLRRSDAKAFNDFLKALKRQERKFRFRRFLFRDNEIAEGYSSMLALLSVGLDCYVHNSPENPHFVRLVSPIRKIGGDNADALYYFAPLSPGKSYRVTGTMGSSVYLGFTIYGGKSPKKFHIVSNASTPEMEIDDDGRFDVRIALKDRAPDKNVITTDQTANCLIVRRYYLDKDAMETHPGVQSIEADYTPGVPPLLSGEEMGQRIRSLEQFLSGWFRLTPMPLPPLPPAYNRLTAPRPASADTGHWSTPDNVHCFGFFRVSNDKGLVIRGRSPKCLYWSAHLWNPYLQTYDYTNHQCALNSNEIELEKDGSFELLVSHKNPGHKNWLSTTGHPRGFVYFRWLQAERVPDKLTTELRKL